MLPSEPRTAVLARFASLRQAVDRARKQLVIDQRELDQLHDTIRGIVSLNGPVAHNNMLFFFDLTDKQLRTIEFRLAADLDHPDGPDLKDPLGIHEATRNRLLNDSKPIIEPDPAAAFEPTGFPKRNGVKLIGRD